MKAKIIRIIQILLGLVFVFSGFVKAIDPLGTAYKLQDYLGVLGLEALVPLAGALAVLLIAFEFVTGVMLVFDWFRDLALIFATALMIVFTPLTLYLAIANPISDCGCFGDALKLTNWQTFWKNVVFDIMIVILWLGKKNLAPSQQTFNTALAGTLVTLAAVFAFQAYNLSYLPVIDFRPYKVGTDLKQALNSVDTVEYQTILIYRNKKTGELHEFTEDNYPWQDTVNWEWVDTKVKEIKKSSPKSEIHDFYFTTLDGRDVTEQILNSQTPVVIIIAHDLTKTKIKGWKKILNFYYKNRTKYNPVIYCATASPREQIMTFLSQNPDFSKVLFVNGDATTLKTIVRANPGILIIKNGVIIDKKSWRQVR